MAQLLSKTELARLAGVTKAAITKAAVKQFPAALVGPRVDVDHADVQRYLAGRARGATNAAQSASEPASEPTAERPSTKAIPEQHGAGFEPTTASKPAPPSLPPDPDATHRDTKPEDIERYAHMTLEQLTRKFGTATAFTDWLTARKRISDIREKDLKNDERAGRLIPRELVRTHVFSHIEAANRRLLQDAATTIARRIYAAAKGGKPVEEAEAIVREIMSSQLRPVKASAARALREGPST